MESKGYSSLFDLVDSHLSQTTLNKTTTNGAPSTTKLHNGSVSESLLFSPKQHHLKLPSFSDSNSPIQGVLTEQVSNMLKAKEKEKQEENHKLTEDMKKIHLDCSNNYVIDLMKSLQTPYKRETFSEESLSTSSSLESLCKMNIAEFEAAIQKQKDKELLLPSVIDMSYIIHENIWKGKSSTFGKVLTSRLRPVAAPYLMDRIETDIKSFDFKTKSPCDIIKDNLKKPFNAFNRF